MDGGAKHIVEDTIEIPCVSTSLITKYYLRISEVAKIHVQNLQKLVIEIYKTMNNLNPSYIWEVHEENVVKYDLRTKNLCQLPKTRTIRFGMESLSLRGSLLRNTLSDQIKALPKVAAFKRAIKHRLGDKCN